MKTNKVACVITNELDQVALLRRPGSWSLPKVDVRNNETTEHAARRAALRYLGVDPKLRNTGIDAVSEKDGSMVFSYAGSVKGARTPLAVRWFARNEIPKNLDRGVNSALWAARFKEL